ncbi:efflux RND transporter periplasmic adaptor subunit [Mesorhizobium soli]|uniref:Efflux RND transporter periplasmic adaptor subunit n=2 Tax=Pseudaminobacter soli (ex Li et al. 2025) TaxID=1295366 RepID=A0A2P7SKS9_9HYPH|nr:efflux RND transporter periplasmic adaptor subunit [Mesorhizobium soli]
MLPILTATTDEDMNKIMRRRYFLVGTLPALAAVSAIFMAYGRPNSVAPTDEPAASQAASLTVAVEPVQAEQVASVVAGTGSVTAWQEAAISTESGGMQLTEVLVEEGDRVKKGDVLARLDSSLLRAQLTEQEAAIEQARATLASAEMASARAEKLLKSSAVSVETAEGKATAVQTGRAQVAQAEAAANRIRVQVDRTEITAPFDGVIASKPAVVGSIVQAGTELMTIIRDDRLEVEVRLPDKDLPSIARGQKATVTDAAGRISAGTVSSVAEKVDRATRLGTVRIALENGAGLKPGMFARVSIDASNRPALTVAENALVWRGSKPAVFVLGDDGKVKSRSVETGQRAGGRVAILSGLSEGESIVVSGAGFLSDGNLVRVSDSAATASAE